MMMSVSKWSKLKCWCFLINNVHLQRDLNSNGEQRHEKEVLKEHMICFIEPSRLDICWSLNVSEAAYHVCPKCSMSHSHYMFITWPVHQKWRGYTCSVKLLDVCDVRVTSVDICKDMSVHLQSCFWWPNLGVLTETAGHFQPYMWHQNWIFLCWKLGHL